MPGSAPKATLPGPQVTIDRLPGVPVATMTPAEKLDCETSTRYSASVAVTLYHTLPFVAGAPHCALIAESWASVVACDVSMVSLNGTALITVAPSIVMQITDAGSAEQVRAQARAPIAFYVGRMGTYYYEMLIRNGFEDEVNKIRAGWEARDPKAAAAGVSDRMLEQTAVVGPLEKCKEDLDERRALGVDLPLIGMPGRDASEMGRVLEVLMR